jgi:hypothetical protein
MAVGDRERLPTPMISDHAHVTHAFLSPRYVNCHSRCDVRVHLALGLPTHSYSGVIREIIPIISPEDDFLAVTEIENQIGTTQESREKDLESITEKLRGTRTRR